MHKISEIPPGHFTVPFDAGLVNVGLSEQLHPHHGKYEDDDAQHKREVGQRADGVGHDGENVVQGLPRLGQLKDAQKSERAEHGQPRDAFG